MSSISLKDNISLEDRFAGCLLGLAVGDAVGTTVEFCARGTFEPMTDMTGGGPFNLEAGQWTDDTSMALCLAASLVECCSFDASDQTQRYVNWRSNGYMSSTGRCFDIGNTVAQALDRFLVTGNPFSGSEHERSAGNGSLMRLAPVPMYYYTDLQDIIQYAGESSRTTHGAAECIEACRLFGLLLYKAFKGLSKEDILFGNKELSFECVKVEAIAKGDYKSKTIDDVRGSGYVIDSLEAALWCFYSTSNYRDTVLKAANLGDDADTTAAICGQIAGAFYGVNGIPDSWRNKVAMKDTMLQLSNSLKRKTNDR